MEFDLILDQILVSLMNTITTAFFLPMVLVAACGNRCGDCGPCMQRSVWSSTS